jgi:hypothetical protein
VRRSTLLPVALLSIAAGCGGSSSGSQEISDHDAGVVVSIVTEATSLWQEATPLLYCDQDCDRPGLRRLRVDARVFATSTAKRVHTVDSPCLRSAMTKFSGAFGELQGYADATLARQDAASLQALDRSDRARFGAMRQLVQCGFIKRGESAGLEAGFAYQAVSAAFTGIEKCRLRACFARAGRRIEQAAHQGRLRFDRVASSSSEPCVAHLSGSVDAFLGAFERYGQAAQRLDPGTMQRMLQRAERYQLALTRGARACLAKAGG